MTVQQLAKVVVAVIEWRKGRYKLHTEVIGALIEALIPEALR